MQNLQQLQDKIFLEARNILETLAGINTVDELLANYDSVTEFSERVAFLRVLNSNKASLAFDMASEIIDSQPKELDLNVSHDNVFDEFIPEDTIEEEIVFTNELNETENSERDQQMITEVAEEQVLETYYEAPTEQDQDYQKAIAEKEKLFLEAEERRRKIVEFDKEIPETTNNQAPVQEVNTPQQTEKKFKIASIKGLKTVQNIFDDDPLQKIADEPEIKQDTGSLLKNNISTDFMEAEKRKPEFRLDLNDKVAFTKILFKGNDDELRTTVDKLNSFTDLEEARKYLSEIYYAKDWGKSDEFAQRLWGLVESKFN